MKILVTGAAGFIGYHLVMQLLANGHHVFGIDNINDYYDVNLKLARLRKCGIEKSMMTEDELLNSSLYPNYQFQKADLTDLNVLTSLFKESNFDAVVNLAAQAGVRYSLENPHAYVESNVVGFMNLLECCRNYKIKHLIYASSSSVYGMTDSVPFSEDAQVDHPVSLYAATKKSNELFAHTYSHLYQLPTTGLRFFTVYGPWGRPDMAPMLFADAIYSGKAIKVFNNGEMLRDFTYVDDIVSGIVKVLDNVPDSYCEKPFYRLLNIGNSTPVALMEFIRLMERETGLDANLEMYPMQPGDVKVTYADTSKLKALTGYQPGTSLEKGVQEFINWFRNYNAQSNTQAK